MWINSLTETGTFVVPGVRTSPLACCSLCVAKDMLVAKKFKGNKVALHSSNLNYLMNVLNKELVVSPSTRSFVVHYLNAHGEVPLWVLANDLTFGNMSHFFQLMKRGDQNAVCKHL